MRTQKRYTEEEKVEIVLMALRNEGSKAELCRQRGISPMSLDAWIKRFIESGKAGLRPDRQSNANGELEALRKENEQLKKALAERELDVRILKKLPARWCELGASCDDAPAGTHTDNSAVPGARDQPQPVLS